MRGLTGQVISVHCLRRIAIATSNGAGDVDLPSVVPVPLRHYRTADRDTDPEQFALDR
jgi:hypothetical protein